MVTNPPSAQETQVQSLGQEDPLEKGMATHSSILAWRIPWTEEAGGLQSMGSQKSQTRQPLTLNTVFLLLLLHQLPLRSSGIISQRLGAPASVGGRGD